MFKCSCGSKTNTIIYKQGKRCCSVCNNSTLSGVWERNNLMERQKYAKDILQPGQAGYEELYGNSKTKKGG